MNMEEVLYISGAITNPPNLNKEKFEKATKSLRALGYIVINPHELCDGIPAERWNDCMKICIRRLVDATTLIQLDDWQLSRGATIEFEIARQLNIKPISYVEFVASHY